MTAAFVAALAVTVGATGLLTFRTTLGTIVRLVDARIEAAADAVVTPEASGNPAALLARIATLTARRDYGDIGFELEDAAGRRLGGNVVIGPPQRPGLSDITGDAGIAGVSRGRVLAVPAGAGMTLIVVAETEPFDGFASQRQRIYLIGFGVIALVVAIGILLFGLLIRARMAAMQRVVDAVMDGDFSRRVPVRAHDDVFGRQAVALNRMLDRIEALMANLRQVSGEIAHDLRGPLARLRARLVNLDAERGDLTDALADCDAVLAQFAALLRLGEVEGRARRAGFAPVDLAAIAREVADAMAPVVEDAGGTLTLAVAAAPVTIAGDAALLRQMLLNLVENAVRHVPGGPAITLAVTADAGVATLAVADDGPGIAPADRALALRRLGRLDRSRGTPGHGLGLSLAEAVARLHGGTLSLEDAAPGLRVVVSVPAA